QIPVIARNDAIDTGSQILETDGIALAPFLAVLVDENAAQNDQQPGQRAGTGFVLVEFGERAQQRVLNQVLGIALVLGEAVCKPVKTVRQGQNRVLIVLHPSLLSLKEQRAPTWDYSAGFTSSLMIGSNRARVKPPTKKAVRADGFSSGIGERPEFSDG